MSYGSLFLLIMTTLPLLYVGFYNHPTGDDIYYGIHAREVYIRTHSLLQTILNASKGVAHDYVTWQGTYSAMFLMRLQPTVFGEQFYFLTPFLVIGSLTLGMFIFLHSLGKHLLHWNKYQFLGTFSLLLMFCLQWVISPGEAFYWYNGSIYYSAFFGILLMFWGMTCDYLFTSNKKTPVLLIFLVVLLGGSNYLTLLWSMIVLVLVTSFCFFKRKSKAPVMLSLTLLQIGCFLVSAAAPGNKIRAASTASLPAYKAILFSLRQGFSFVVNWVGGWWLLGAVLLSFFLIPVIKKLTFSFPLPAVVVGFLFGFFSSLSCPTYYAQSNAGPGRALNLSSYGFILTSYTALFYVLGYLMKRYDKELESIRNKTACKRKWIFLLPFLLLIWNLGYGCFTGKVFLFPVTQAMQDICSGEIVAYHQEYKDRLLLMESSKGRDVVLTPFLHRPHTVYVGDYGADPKQGSNQALAKWYGVASIRVEYENNQP